MNDSYAAALDLLLPYLPPQLAPDELHDALYAIARGLPPIYRGIFECHLAAARVDLHQSVAASRGEPRQFRAHLQHESHAAHPAWSGINRFFAAWDQPESRLGPNVRNVWLEFDSQQAPDASAGPSFFVSLNYKQQSKTLRADLWQALLAALAILGEEDETGPTAHHLRKLAEACPPQTGITHIGFMLPRDGRLVRVNIKGLAPAQLAPYLQRIDWPGNSAAAVAKYAQLAELVDNVVVCVDIIGDGTRPPIGFECFCDEQKALHKGKWPAFLAYLGEQALCTPAQTAALAAWPGNMALDRHAAAWPGDLARAAQQRPPTHFSLFQRRMSHIKLNYLPGSAAAAKAYLYFEHTWLELDDAQTAGAVTTNPNR